VFDERNRRFKIVCTGASLTQPPVRNMRGRPTTAAPPALRTKQG
jgi:hypothetical protein